MPKVSLDEQIATARELLKLTRELAETIENARQRVPALLLRERYHSSASAARFLGVHENTLLRWRKQGMGPPFERINRQLVAYREEDLIAFKTARPVAPSTETPQ